MGRKRTGKARAANYCHSKSTRTAMSILDTDKILVNRSGSSYQVEAQNFDKVQDDDLLLVNRGDKHRRFSVASGAGNLDSKLLDDDILLINRDGLSYRCTGLEFKEISGGGGAGEFGIQYYPIYWYRKALDIDVDLTEGGFVWIKSDGAVIAQMCTIQFKVLKNFYNQIPLLHKSLHPKMLVLYRSTKTVLVLVL